MSATDHGKATDGTDVAREPVSREAVVDYVAVMSAELSRMASAADLAFLAYLLHMAHEEALSLRDEVRGSKPAP